MLIIPQPVRWLRGDPRWALASPLASYAPVVVLSLLVIGIIQIVLGAVWIANLDDLNFPLILQPLVLPCISLFNTVLSAHLHLYSRNNNPLLVIWFSGILGLLYLGSAMLNLIVCSGSSTTLRAECRRSSNLPNHRSGPNISQDFWDAVVGLWLISALGYLLHVAMAVKVLVVTKRRDREARAEGRERAVDLVWINLTPEQRARREQKARDRWQRIVDL